MADGVPINHLTPGAMRNQTKNSILLATAITVRK